MNMHDYTTGYKHALEGMDMFITSKIKSMGGVETAVQVITLYNAIMQQLHSELVVAKQELKGFKKNNINTDTDINALFSEAIDELFNGIKIKEVK